MRRLEELARASSEEVVEEKVDMKNSNSRRTPSDDEISMPPTPNHEIMDAVDRFDKMGHGGDDGGEDGVCGESMSSGEGDSWGVSWANSGR
jgi:hypothetical protein